MKLAIYSEKMDNRKENPIGQALQLVLKTTAGHESTIVNDESSLYEELKENQYDALVMVSVNYQNRGLSLAKAVRRITNAPIYSIVMKKEGETLENITDQNIREVNVLTVVPDLLALLAQAEKSKND